MGVGCVYRQGDGGIECRRASGTAVVSTFLLRRNGLSRAGVQCLFTSFEGGGEQLQDCCNTWNETVVEVDHPQVALKLLRVLRGWVLYVTCMCGGWGWCLLC